MGKKTLLIIGLVVGVPVMAIAGLIASYIFSIHANPFDVAQLRHTKSCPHCNLKGTDFSGMDLQRANLQEADLRGVIFDRANLRQADLQGANVGIDSNARSTRFEDANLSQANLSGLAFVPGDTLLGANLSGANLENAQLISINFTGANLTRANLKGADLTYANLQKAAVEEVRVDANTKIGSYYRSKGSRSKRF